MKVIGMGREKTPNSLLLPVIVLFISKFGWCHSEKKKNGQVLQTPKNQLEKRLKSRLKSRLKIGK
jgi:hypothetical protein